MGEHHKVKIGERIITPIDWEMSPDLSFGTYESWGGRERVRNNDEMVYYFFVDNWGDEPKLCLMERAVKHAIVLAEIKAPLEMVKECVASQGTSSRFEKSYAINVAIRDWLIENVLDGGHEDLIIPLVEEGAGAENMGAELPEYKSEDAVKDVTLLPVEASIINDEDIEGVIKKWNFYDERLNPEGRFENDFARLGDDVVVDRNAGLMWQRGGLDISSTRSMHLSIAELNKKGFAGFNDWRMPTMEEAMSLMEPTHNDKAVYLHSCFSKEQPFIFVAAKRKPGGYWFVDFKQGCAFYSSGSIPGGFGRLVRTV